MDNASYFRSKDVAEYLCQVMGTKIIYSSKYHPQGNGLNESCHRLIEFAIETWIPSTPSLTFIDAVSDAVLIYNCTPLPAIGDTPASLVFGQDLTLPGLQQLSPRHGDEVREMSLRERRLLQFVLDDIALIQSSSQNNPIQINDLVYYEFGENEDTKRRPLHYSGCAKYRPSWSLPHRVLKVTGNKATLRPLWYNGAVQEVPISRIRRFTSRIPPEFRKLSSCVIRIIESLSSTPEGEAMMNSPCSHHPVDLDGIAHKL